MSELLLSAHDLLFTRGLRTILEIPELEVYDGDRIGLVGENGAGKSTLLSLLAGSLAPDSGQVRRNCDVALIRQTGDTGDEAEADLAARFGWVEARDSLSGGERTRRRISAALSRRAPLLLADEPTTDLDAGGIRELTQALERYPGALVIVSHDRALLDRLCRSIWHLEDGRLTAFPGNWTAYRQELEQRRGFARDEYDRYRREQARLRASIQAVGERAAGMRKAPKRMGLSEARLHRMDSRQISGKLHQAQRQLEARLERLEVKERPREDVSIRMELGAFSPIPAKTALELRDVTLRAGDRTLLKGASLTLPTGSRTALTGPNGSGKTTLLRAIAAQAGLNAGEGFRAEGRIRLHGKLRAGWFDQDHLQTLDPELSAVDNVRAGSRAGESDARTVLARLAIRGDDALKPLRVLSGGEAARVALARLLLADVNFLMLDEPTNHLDLFTRQALEELLQGYRGTLLLVTHDEAFLRAVATRQAVIREGRILLRDEPGAGERPAARAEEDRRVKIAALEMRMAELGAKLALPRREEETARLNAEYLALAKEVRALREGEA